MPREIREHSEADEEDDTDTKPVEPTQPQEPEATEPHQTQETEATEPTQDTAESQDESKDQVYIDAARWDLQENPPTEEEARERQILIEQLEAEQPIPETTEQPDDPPTTPSELAEEETPKDPITPTDQQSQPEKEDIAPPAEHLAPQQQQNETEQQLIPQQEQAIMPTDEHETHPTPIRDAETLETELDRFPHLREHPHYEKLRADCDTYFQALQYQEAHQRGEISLYQISKEVGATDTRINSWLVKEGEPRLIWLIRHEQEQAATLEGLRQNDTQQPKPAEAILRAAYDPAYREKLLPPADFTPETVTALLDLRKEHKTLDPATFTKITDKETYQQALRAFPLIQTLNDFDTLHKQVQLYFMIKEDPPTKSDGKLPIGALCEHFGITKNCIHNWLKDRTQPDLITTLEKRATTLREYQNKLKELREKDNGITDLHELNKRLCPSHIYFFEHIVTDPAFPDQLTDSARYLAILQLVEAGYPPADLDRYFKLHKDYTGDTIRYQHRPHLVQLAANIPKEEPEPSKYWLPTTTDESNMPARYIQVPQSISDWREIIPIIEQLPTPNKPDEHLTQQLQSFEIDNKTLQQWQQQFGPIETTKDKLLAFAYLVGTSLSDGWIEQQSTISSSFGIELSKKYDWAPTYGNRTAYYWTSLGIPIKQGEGREVEDNRPHGLHNWFSVTTPFLTYFNEAVLGFRPGETHTYTPAKISWVLDAPPNFQIRVLQGLFDGDGWAIKHEIAIHSHQNRDIIREVLSRLGIEAKNRGDYELTIRGEGIIKAANLPIFLSATGRQQRAEVAMRTAEVRFVYRNSDLVNKVLELHGKGVTIYGILDEIRKEHGIWFSERAINKILRKCSDE